MGKKALQVNRATKRNIREAPLTASERSRLRSEAAYEGSP